ncbi:tol-pal system-associated acyl-CoA thioesterase [Thauera sp.]|jgi:acyl-CoA thioester hydrolase|uniref:tol-pal system-associated acyl-CoA thioesterase n=1 Tax=Thauera sp. TaxID=1905334 RepID=UPI002A363030|nr:tol-pal system-associated acyl-CoA thioesterase [Thauera sp.]MDX9884175.1 tol-pal system-associated acyl-CoA thioesterase [Thauera sp.]
MQPRIERDDARASDTQASSQLFTLPVRVYYEDTDAGGVVYYANYLKFCERARAEWLRTLGVSQQALIDEQGLAFVVRSVQADYLASARLDDALEVVTRIAMLRRASILFEQQVMRGPELLFNTRVLLASIDLHRQKPVAIPASLHDLLESKA